MKELYKGRCLVSTPTMSDRRFQKSVVFLCEHSKEGSMGVVINAPFKSIFVGDILGQLNLSAQDHQWFSKEIMFGGPAETGRGFVLHSPDYMHQTSVMVEPTIALTTTIDILYDMSSGKGPVDSLLALGYADWSPGQLDEEIRDNAWLTVPADPDLLFHVPAELRWSHALKKLDIESDRFSPLIGRA